MAARFWVLGLVLLSWLSVASAEEFAGKLIGVSDGDTVTVLRDKTPMKFRLNGIDCPETFHPFGFECEWGNTVARLRDARLGIRRDTYSHSFGVRKLPVAALWDSF